MSIQIEKRVSTIASLKEIIVFLAALTFTNAISILLLDEPTKHLRSITTIGVSEWICFAILVFGVVRFYHGNFRLLDENYNIGANRGGLASAYRRNIIGFDFLCVLLVALVFALLSFYVRDFSHFICLYVAIVLVDVVWLYVTNVERIIRWSTSGFSIQTSGLGWFYNNVLFLVLLLLFVAIYYSWVAVTDHDYLQSLTDDLKGMTFESDRNLFWGMTGIILLNSAVDFMQNRYFYFPSRNPREFEFILSPGSFRRVFLAAPFTQLVRRENGTDTIGSFKAVLQGVIELFESKNLHVFNAHRREAWGQSLENPKQALSRDLEEMARADLVVAIVGSPPSPGVQLELGYAIAFQKPILVLCKRGDFVPYLNGGLDAVTPSKFLEYDHESQISDLLRRQLLL